MDTRKKFTYRYNESIAKLLNEASKKYDIKVFNDIISKLIVEAVENLPNEISTQRKKIQVLQEQVQTVLKEKNIIEKKYNNLKGIIRMRVQNGLELINLNK